MSEVQESLRHEQTCCTWEIQREMPTLPECDGTSVETRARENGAAQACRHAAKAEACSCTYTLSGSRSRTAKDGTKNENIVSEVQESLCHRQT